MILKTFDGKEMYITEAQRVEITAAVNGGAKMIVLALPNGKTSIAAGAIATITPGGEPPKSTAPRLIANRQETPEEAEARAARNRGTLAKMKSDLISKGVLGG